VKNRIWGAIATISSLLISTPLLAAEQIIVRFSPIEQAIAVKELRSLVDTQKQSSTIASIIEKTSLSPQEISNYLALSFDIKQFGLTIPLVDRLLSSYAGEVALREIGRAIRPTGGESAIVQALRLAIISSLIDDGKISAIEFFEKYPTDILIDVVALQETVGRVLKDTEDLREPILRILQRSQAS
jgi:Alpha/beta hydrolase of unknown function (DUF1400)